MPSAAGQHPPSKPRPASTPRDHARLAWTRRALADDAVRLNRASTDAGFRSYWRSEGRDGSRIVMDSPPELEDVRPWLRVRDLLEAGGVRVPRVLAADVEAGFLLLEDLGGSTLAQLLSGATTAACAATASATGIDAQAGGGADTDTPPCADPDAWFDAAIGQLLKLQAIAPPAELGAFDAALLQRDARLFEEWFLGRHLRLELDDSETAALRRVQTVLRDNLLAQAQVLVHRDFMPRNLMPVLPGPAVLDFQDGVRGPIAYDPVSLFRDAFLGWPPSRVDGWLARYHASATDAGLPVPATREVFLRDADWCGVQRHLKVLGVFARLHYRDGKPKYLADALRFVGYLQEVLPRYAELLPLLRLLERRIEPALRASLEGDP